MGKLLNHTSSEVARERGLNSAKILSEVTGVDGSSHTCISKSRYLGYRRSKNQKVGITSSEVTSYDPPRS
jgi:hypothetical protein